MDDSTLAAALQKEYDREAAQSISADDEWPKFSRADPVSTGGITNVSRRHGSLMPKSVVDPEWELLDPNPDIRSLFQEFNAVYFWNKLSMVEVRWSPRMTLCAGLCCYEGRGGLCSVRLSQPLLLLRPRKDLVETLLHEMIHALLFVTDNNRDHDGHGPEFCKHMRRINATAGCNITIYHNFHDEVDHLRQHWWRCQGSCRTKPPYFGYVRRSMNRAPSSRDPWWPRHQRSCGGTYVKVKEPEGYGKKKAGGKQVKQPSPLGSDIVPFLSQHGKAEVGVNEPSSSGVSVVKAVGNPSGHRLGGLNSVNSNHRGIPLTSKLLSSNSENKATQDSLLTNSTEMKDMNAGNKWMELATSKKSSGYSTTKPKNKFKNTITIPELIAKMKNNGRKSVNAGAEAFKTIPPVTNFGKKLLFEDSTDDFLAEKENNNTELKKHVANKVEDKTTSWNPKLYCSFSTVLDSDDEDMCDTEEICANVATTSTSSKMGSEFSPAKNYLPPEGSCVNGPDLVGMDFDESIESGKVRKRLSSLSDEDENATLTEIWQKSSSKKLKLGDVSQSEDRESGSERTVVCCPICNMSFPLESINRHIDDCLSLQAIRDSSFD